MPIFFLTRPGRSPSPSPATRVSSRLCEEQRGDELGGSCEGGRAKGQHGWRACSERRVNGSCDASCAGRQSATSLPRASCLVSGEQLALSAAHVDAQAECSSK